MTLIKGETKTLKHPVHDSILTDYYFECGQQRECGQGNGGEKRIRKLSITTTLLTFTLSGNSVKSYIWMEKHKMINYHDCMMTNKSLLFKHPGAGEIFKGKD